MSQLSERYRPPLLLRNPHVQTILGQWLSGPRFGFPTVRRLLPLGDGDAMVLHDSTPPPWEPGHPIVIIAHGLGGCHDSGHLRRFARQFAKRGIRTVRLDLRGCGAGIPFARQTYHAGRSNDIFAVLDAMHQLEPDSPLILIGVSLGGNAVLKMAGERGDHIPGLAKLIALGAPVDMRRCSAMIEEKRNRMYDRYFVKLLVRRTEERAKCFPDMPVVSLPSKMTLRRFDDLVTAPLNGFRDADDYYDRAAAKSLIPSITVPTLLMTSRDDPFIAVEPYEAVTGQANLDVHILDYGGHLGILGGDGRGGYRWGERRVVEWAMADLYPLDTES